MLCIPNTVFYEAAFAPNRNCFILLPMFRITGDLAQQSDGKDKYRGKVTLNRNAELVYQNKPNER